MVFNSLVQHLNERVWSKPEGSIELKVPTDIYINPGVVFMVKFHLFVKTSNEEIATVKQRHGIEGLSMMPTFFQGKHKNRLAGYFWNSTKEKIEIPKGTTLALLEFLKTHDNIRRMFKNKNVLKANVEHCGDIVLEKDEEVVEGRQKPTVEQ